MTALDYAAVSRYWDTATPSILGPYMMDGFGFPAGAGQFRFQAECKIVNRLIQGLDRDGCVLDLGSGIGFWAEYFARRFSRVVAVEASQPLYEALKDRCSQYPNIKTIQDNVLRFHAEDRYVAIFLGGLLMYLNEADVISLLKRLTSFLQPGGLILCRETTIRQGTITRQGDYQAVYRSVANYERIFTACALSISTVQRNVPYVLMQMGCEVVKKWTTVMPARLQCIPLVGRLAYWGLRLGYPWITHVPAALGLAYPELNNHFFVLQADASRISTGTAYDHAA